MGLPINLCKFAHGLHLYQIPSIPSNPLSFHTLHSETDRENERREQPCGTGLISSHLRVSALQSSAPPPHPHPLFPMTNSDLEMILISGAFFPFL